MASFLQIITGKGRTKKGGTSITPSFNASNPTNVLSLPQYRDHLTDIFTSRVSDDSRDLLKSLFKHDPDVSATVNSYLTLANTAPLILVRDLEENIDRDMTKQLGLMIKKIVTPTDYTKKFQLRQSLSQLCADLRYMLLLRGGVGAELILDQNLAPDELRQIDTASLEWIEQKPGVYKPQQRISGINDPVSLDIPSFFITFFRRDPTSIYTYSNFVAAVNTIAARQQVINDLYRIMKITGFPRLDIKVVEEVLLKNAPANVKSDPELLKPWMAARLNEVRVVFENPRADQAFIHFDSVEPSILNDQKPGASVDISAVVDTLNAQNQAGLKTMATVIGRGTQGVNTSSVEARIAAMNADELNEPIADLLSQIFSFMLHQQSYQGFAYVEFRKAELRPDLELEPQKTLKAQRLRQDLSDGLITDDEYSLWNYGRLSPDGAPQLSGTGFMTPAPAGGAGDPTANSDPLGRSLAPEGGKMTKSNAVKQ